MEEGVIPEPLLSPKVHTFKDLEDLFLVEEPDEGFLKAFLWDVNDSIGQRALLWMDEPDHLRKRLKGGKPEIAGLGKVFALFLELIEEGDDEL